MCGGTRIKHRNPHTIGGLSPRVRGNHVNVTFADGTEGSIPACAGEPSRGRGLHRAGQVYPRVCGGTMAAARLFTLATGLSPRVRGNHGSGPAVHTGNRSIPACAGEPTWPTATPARNKVYPRVCGGTGLACAACSSSNGLSPRVRGNQRQNTSVISFRRSIPACAGEPDRNGRPSVAPEVYPRVCGGTPVGGQSAALSRGLSPRVRGNRRGQQVRPDNSRSIPACAGEPAG